MIRAVAIVLALAAASAGCGDAIQRAALDTTASIMWRSRRAMEQESDLTLARQAIPGGLKQAEGIYVANPGNRSVRRLLAAGYCGYASFVHDEWEVAIDASRFEEAEQLAARAASLYLRCVNYALTLLGDGWQRGLYGSDDEVRALLRRADASALPGLYWAATGLAGAINMKMGDMRVVAHLGKVPLLLERVIELDETHEHGMAHVLLGAILCGRSGALGGEPKRGMSHFARATELSGGKMLMASVLMARHCAVAMQDRSLFHDTLVQVLRAPPGLWPEQRLANEFARHKARRYLARESELF